VSVKVHAFAGLNVCLVSVDVGCKDMVEHCLSRLKQVQIRGILMDIERPVGVSHM
jgi:hypothetical protein